MKLKSSFPIYFYFSATASIIAVISVCYTPTLPCINAAHCTPSPSLHHLDQGLSLPSQSDPLAKPLFNILTMVFSIYERQNTTCVAKSWQARKQQVLRNRLWSYVTNFVTCLLSRRGESRSNFVSLITALPLYPYCGGKVSLSILFFWFSPTSNNEYQRTKKLNKALQSVKYHVAPHLQEITLVLNQGLRARRKLAAGHYYECRFPKNTTCLSSQPLP